MTFKTTLSFLAVVVRWFDFFFSEFPSEEITLGDLCGVSCFLRAALGEP